MDVLAAPCFWALLTPEQFRFAYLPDSVAQTVVGDDKQSVRTLLQNRSLLDFIHPEELSIAQADLERFLRVRTLAGSITRCRLLSFDHVSGYQNARPTPAHSTRALTSASSHNRETKCVHSSVYIASSSVETSYAGIKPSENDQWQIMDIVLYIATESILLAFFHNTGN
ncbi:hypothetical protein BDB00DRAFT_788168 [Zychaea mexicana]|uniref:uncharacterized protein n=1 Tax=Zychaea mexicana TaxID=64656 RepID=UPI0022FEFEE9|nr:uncharacterized protein BDB00DRAFT_788168 [Zychaea mexicana]KAI9493113.1 hypothetical protein BDB00DRAFT_788168 [Zychaea mexicana]